MKVLYVESSPRKQRSASIEVAQAFLTALGQKASDLSVDKLDVWGVPLPEFDGAALQAKYAGLEGRERTSEEKAAWDAINILADRFKQADVLLFSIPMWNWTVPYKLKHLIDVISQKDVLFTFDERGINGLLTKQRAVCIYARGADYSPGSGLDDTWDHQKPLMDTWLKSIGVTDVATIVVQKTLFGPEPDRAARDAASVEARGIACRLAG